MGVASGRGLTWMDISESWMYKVLMIPTSHFFLQTLAELINRNYRAASAVLAEDSANINILIRDEIPVSFHADVDWSRSHASLILVSCYHSSCSLRITVLTGYFPPKTTVFLL